MKINKKTFYILSRILGVIFFVTSALIFYVDHYLPHGKSYSTGDYVCEYDGRGPCREDFKEDMRGLDIPGWAKSLREYDILYLMGIAILGFYFNSKANDDLEDEKLS